MSVAIVTGSGGLVGSAACEHFAAQGMSIVGVDNDMRSWFFGEEASTAWNTRELQNRLGRAYTHESIDIRDRDGIAGIFNRHGKDISLVVHTAAQPSHDWAAKQPLVDFDINATGTLNVLESTRQYAPEAVFIFTSTNKVYGDQPNNLPLIEKAKRYEIDPRHTYSNGIREDMSIDGCLHSVFGASKVAADVMVQEYGRYFGLKTACFRGGTLTGENHSATELHGFLAYVMRCTMSGTHYKVFGYKGKQVRDAIHSSDLVRAFDEYFKAPCVAEVYNIGGGRFSNCSVLEAIELCQEITGTTLDWSYEPSNR
ncbi:MAG: NAD-dependent epimerase/dehydratase family protein, partial [Acidimicrobiia bacterium]